ncbi:MAG: dihydroneopterin aldolase [Muribaculaceae bacterium]|nr:dihydroneopterin aldolase [Muribaculaceae bacterium]
MRVTVEIERLRLRAFHGVCEQERRVGNTFEVTVRMDYDVADEAMSGDRMADFISYADVAQAVKEEMAVPSDLLEHVAWRIRSRLLAAFPQVSGGMVKVAKLMPPMGCELAYAAATVYM